MADHVDGFPVPDDTDALPGGRSRGSFGGTSLPTMDSSDFWSDRYKMDHKERGLAIIINNKTFDESTGLGARQGSDTDAAGMRDLLEDTLGFETNLQNDCSVKLMKKMLKEAAEVDFQNKDCFVCVILSHGDEGYVYGTDDKIAIDDLVSPFKGNKCRSLAGKPKLFFIQACRGTKLDHGVDYHDGEGESDEVDVRRIPTEADFLMSYSVVPGFYSWRNSDNGSYFIQALIEIIKTHWKKLDLLTMLTRVNKKVAFDFESQTKDSDTSGKKQMPCITSMLTKDVFFTEK